MVKENSNNLSLQELLILVNTNDHIIGYEDKQKCHQGEGLLHRAFSIFIFNEHKQLLIQKRSAEKLLWPLYWSNSVCSHPRKGESYNHATIRRLREELGFETQLAYLFKFHYQSTFKNIGSEHEMCSVYIGKTNNEVHANQNEIAEWKYVDVEKLDENMSSHPYLYTPWFKIEWKRIKECYQTNIQNLSGWE